MSAREVLAVTAKLTVALESILLDTNYAVDNRDELLELLKRAQRNVCYELGDDPKEMTGKRQSAWDWDTE